MVVLVTPAPSGGRCRADAEVVLGAQAAEVIINQSALSFYRNDVLIQ